MKKDTAHRAEEHGNRNHFHYRNRSFNQSRIVGINLSKQFREKESEHHQRSNQHENNSQHSMNKRYYILSPVSSDQVTHHRTDSSCKRRTRNHQQNVQTAADISSCQRSLSHSFDKDEKHEPGRDGNEKLKHDEYRNLQYLAYQLKINSFKSI
ncbi:hypothetical protein SDC9_158660 [bioreactor metagenome]|uniref:Uncharacterized protein n=1 Tax=bioreactor metagenome TaxID=1076179 RepID=A0A645FDA7_9ZZZZ